MKLLSFLFLMVVISCIYPHELRKEIIEPTYDEWSEGYSETSAEIIMSQLDEDYTAIPISPLGGDFEWSPMTFGEEVIYLSDFIQYETECYNDSTEVVVHVGEWCVGLSTGYGDFECISYGHYDTTKWIHREPIFTGFIEWIKIHKR